MPKNKATQLSLEWKGWTTYEHVLFTQMERLARLRESVDNPSVSMEAATRHQAQIGCLIAVLDAIQRDARETAADEGEDWRPYTCITVNGTWTGWLDYAESLFQVADCLRRARHGLYESATPKYAVRWHRAALDTAILILRDIMDRAFDCALEASRMAA
jgi:hypothetical protein